MNIELIPAIDLIDGQCVRLSQGNYAQKTVYDLDPLHTAKTMEQMGVQRLHVVDLDGAKAHHVVNLNVLQRLSQGTRLRIDFGGGIKTTADLEQVFEAGASMATIGSVAVTQPQLMATWLQRFGAQRLILGADVLEGQVRINGWKDDGGTPLLRFLEQWVEAGVTQVLCTDISRDGMLAGPSLTLYKEVMARFPQLYLIASGGVSCAADVEALDRAGVPAVVFGKAYYEGKLNLKQMMEGQL